MLTTAQGACQSEPGAGPPFQSKQRQWAGTRDTLAVRDFWPAAGTTAVDGLSNMREGESGVVYPEAISQ